jgi:hypothetical protein
MQTVTSTSHIVDLIQQSEKKGKFVNAFNSGSRLEREIECVVVVRSFLIRRSTRRIIQNFFVGSKEFLATHRQLFVDMWKRRSRDGEESKRENI